MHGGSRGGGRFVVAASVAPAETADDSASRAAFGLAERAARAESGRGVKDARTGHRTQHPQHRDPRERGGGPI